MWMWKLFLVAFEFLFYTITVSEGYGWCTCRSCYHCTGCSARSCTGRSRALSLLDYLEAYSREVKRQLAVTPPVITCTVPNTLCNYPYNKYCCALQSDGTKTCGLGEGWSTCVSGSTLINNVITPIYTKNLCDFDFSCTGNGGNDCCGGLDLYNGEGPGTCSTAYCTSTPLVACNYVGNAAPQYKTPAFDASVMVNGIMPTQVNNKYCGENNISNRNNGRCRASNLCCSPLGLCDVDAASCATKSISWAWMGGSINDWAQTGGAADSSIPCGNGTIGNGRCPTDDNTYGVTCCSDTGYCSSSFCNGADGNVYTCNCAHGTPASGTRGCVTCSSCNEYYYLSSSNSNTCSPIKLGNFNCPSGTFVTSIDLWYDSGSKSITGIDFFNCSDGSKKLVYKGQSTGIHVYSTQISGYCGGKVGYVYGPLGTKNQLTTELTVASCDGTTSTSFGGPVLNYPQNGAITYNFQSGYFLTGMQAATCQNGSVNNVCFFAFTFKTVLIAPTSVPVPTATPTAPTSVPVPTATPGPTSPTTKKPTIVPTAVPTAIPSQTTTTVSCSSGKFVTKINLSAGRYVNGITSITCSDNALMQVSTGLTGSPYTAISGDGTSASLGYCSYRSGVSTAFVTQLKFIECTGTTDGTYGTTSFTTTTVKCPTGQKAIGISFTGGGGFLTSFTFVCGTIARNVSCGGGLYVTQITLSSSDVVYGISSITCSDGSSKQVNTGLISGAPSTANSTGGYCTYSTGLSGSFITQLTLGECTTSATDGPFGSNTATVTTHGCASGQMVIGVKTSTGTALTSFSFACATVTTAAPTTIKPTTPPSAHILEITTVGGYLLNLMEVSIIGGTSLVATLDSTFPDGSSAASNCVDGDPNTKCNSATGPGKLTITYTGTASSIVVTNRLNGYLGCNDCQDRINGAKMFLDGSLLFTFPSVSATTYTVSTTHTLKITTAGGNFLNLMEVGIIGGSNLLATLDTTYDGSSAASNCVDGNLSTMCASATGPGTLTITYTGIASSIVVTNRLKGYLKCDDCQDRINGAKMFLDGSLIYTFPTPSVMQYTAGVVPVTTTAAAYGIIGCYQDNGSSRDLPYQIPDSSTSMSYSYCANACKAKGYSYYGVQNAVDCFCGNSFGRYGTATCVSTGCAPTSGLCACTGDSSQTCGSFSINKVGVVCQNGYMDKSGNCIVVTSGMIGCYGDIISPRDLPWHIGVNSISNSYLTCAKSCKNAGYFLFGVQNAVDCFCGNSFGAYNTATCVSTGCNTTSGSCACPGDSSQRCGSFSVNNVGVVSSFAV